MEEEIVYSSHQKDFFKEVKYGTTHVVVGATAGSGKTFSALESLKYIPKFKKIIFLSFSNVIVKELKSRIPDYVKASTLHSLGFSMIARYRKGTKLNPNKYFAMAMNKLKVKDLLDKKDKESEKKGRELLRKSFLIQDISSYARNTMTELRKAPLIDMCNYYGLEYDEKTIDIVIELIEKGNKSIQIDFADMIYQPAIKPQMIDESYDFVIYDEVQDANMAQLEFVKNLIHPKGRFILIGDPKQALYSFTGSRIDSFEIARTELAKGVKPLSLPVTYRCGKTIVAEAHKVYEDIVAFEGNDDGIVRRGHWSEIGEKDMVLSRTNAPLVSLYFDLIRDGIKAKIIGKETEQGILELARSCMSTTKDTFFENIEKKLEYLEDKLRQRGVRKPKGHPAYQALFEKCEMVMMILGQVLLPSQLIDRIEDIFDDTKEGATLQSIHKSKGTENNRVFLLTHFNGEQLMPHKNANKKWEIIQENNILFVALTRAKKELVYFTYSDELD